jgi:hypothetical protein
MATSSKQRDVCPLPWMCGVCALCLVAGVPYFFLLSWQTQAQGYSSAGVADRMLFNNCKDLVSGYQNSRRLGYPLGDYKRDLRNINDHRQIGIRSVGIRSIRIVVSCSGILEAPERITEAPERLIEVPDRFTEAPDRLTEALDKMTEASYLLIGGGTKHCNSQCQH